MVSLFSLLIEEISVRKEMKVRLRMSGVREVTRSKESSNSLVAEDLVIFPFRQSLTIQLRFS